MDIEEAKKEKISQLHCGACMTNFDSIEDLNKHLDNCPAAVNMLPLVYQLWSGNDKVGHPLSHFIQNLHKNTYLIKRYAYSIANEMDSFHRSKLHVELCEKLDIDYNKFRPFESTEIIKILDCKEAEEILWEELYNYANKFLIKQL